MSDTSKANEYALQPVPKEIGISGWRIALIKVGVLIALPAFIMGAELGFKLGYTRSLTAFVAGAVILFILAAGTSTIGARTRLSTSMLLQFVFGRYGAQVVSVVLAATLTGWFGVTAELFGETLEHIASQVLSISSSAAVYIISGGVLMIITTIFGIRGLQRLADMAVPILLFALGLMAYYGYQEAQPGALSYVPAGAVPIGVGISAVVGSMAAGVTIFPDVCRFAHSPGHGRLAAFLTLGAGVPVVLGLAALPSVATGEGNLIAIMVKLGLGIPALLMLVFTAWTTNSGNLYSSSLMMATVMRSLSQRTLVIAIGILGIVLAVGGISDYIIPVLLLVGFSVPPIAGIYIVDFFIVRGGIIQVETWKDLPAFRIPALVAWATGVTVALFTSNDVFSLTTIPACDSIFSALLLYMVFHKAGWTGTAVDRVSVRAKGVAAERGFE